MAAAKRLGAELRMGTVEGLSRSLDDAALTGVVVDGAVLEADAVVVAMGPWSILACGWLPRWAV